MRHLALVFGALAAAATVPSAHAHRHRPRRRLGEQEEKDTEPFECDLVEVSVELVNENNGNNSTTTTSNDQEEEEEEAGSNDEPETPRFLCITDRDQAHDQAYTIDLPPRAVDMLYDHSHLSISQAHVNPETAHVSVDLDDGQVQIGITPRPRRRLARTTGASQVLVLRVTYLNSSPRISADELMGSVFGLGRRPQPHTLVSQFRACSFGQLTMVPASGAGIVNGVAEISIDERVTGSDEVVSLDNAVVDKANNIFGRLRDQYDHVILVLPPGLKYRGSDWLAYGYLDSWRSVFQDTWAGSLSALMHETGHNLNLHHSGKGREHYGDTSGYMGWGTTSRGTPTSCFNAQKNFDLGWYQDRTTSLTVDDLPWGGYLAFFGEYDKTSPNQSVVINIGDRSDRIYMQYNRAKGINAETRDFADQVVIVGDTGDSSRFGEQSWIEGAIGLTDESPSRNYRVLNFEGSNQNLFIRVCEQVKGSPDYVRMSIHLQDLQRDTCNEDLDEPEVCDDDMLGAFFVDDGRGFKNCGWLIEAMRSYPDWFGMLCQPGQSAHDVCQETCKKCTDTCEDQVGPTFYINTRHGNKDCEWLSSRAPWIQKLCVPGNDAMKYCAETCNVCD